MWVMTTGGFVSAVQEKDDPSLVSVRARDRESLQTVVDSVEMVSGLSGPVIRTGEGTDYPYRITVSKEAFAQWLAFEVNEYITYPNFKDAVTSTRGSDWHDALISVWTAMIKITDQGGRKHGYYAPVYFGSYSKPYRKPKKKKNGARSGW